MAFSKMGAELAGRIRTIKPELLEDEKMATLTDRAWRLYVSMWLLADDYGNCRASRRYLASQVWQDTTVCDKADEALAELEALGRVRLYEANNERYANIPSWNRHQRIDNAGKPRVPPPPFQEFSENLGDSRLDLRPPTNDHDQESKIRKRKPNTEKLAGHSELVAHYFSEFQRIRGAKPSFGAREGRSANKLLAELGLSASKDVVSRALADPFWGQTCSMNTIASDPAKFVGTPVKRVKQATEKQPSTSRSWEPPEDV